MTHEDWSKLRVGSLVMSGPESDEHMGVITHVEFNKQWQGILLTDWVMVQWLSTAPGSAWAWGYGEPKVIQVSFWDFVGRNVEIVQDPDQ